MKKSNSISDELRDFSKSKEFKILGLCTGAASSVLYYLLSTFQSFYAGCGYSESGNIVEYSISFYNKLPPSHFDLGHTALYLTPLAVSIGLSYLFYKLDSNPKTNVSIQP